MPIMSERYLAKEKMLEIRVKLVLNVPAATFRNTSIHEFDDGVSIYINLGYGKYTNEVNQIMNFLDSLDYFDNFTALCPRDKNACSYSSVTYVKRC